MTRESGYKSSSCLPFSCVNAMSCILHHHLDFALGIKYQSPLVAAGLTEHLLFAAFSSLCRSPHPLPSPDQLFALKSSLGVGFILN